MGIQLHIVDFPKDNISYYTNMDDPGAMFRYAELDEDDRECWAISLPNKAGLWLTTQKDSSTGEFWKVTGVAPNISVHPSIDAGERWHGWIKNGVME